MNILENRANCMNGVKDYMNKIAPELIKELNKGFKLTQDNRLFKKDKERIDKIINSIPHFRAYIDISEYSIMLNVDNHYSVSEYSVNYYAEYVYLWSKQRNEPYEYKNKEMVSLNELLVAEQKLSELQDQHSKIQSEISRLKILLDN